MPAETAYVSLAEYVFFQIGRHPAKLQATVFWRLFGLSLAFRRRCLFFLRHPLAYTPAPAVGDSRHVKLCCVLDKAPAARAHFLHVSHSAARASTRH